MIVSVNNSHAMFSRLSTRNDLVMQALDWCDLVWHFIHKFKTTSNI